MKHAPVVRTGSNRGTRNRVDVAQLALDNHGNRARIPA